ncbi:hypothetical protein SAMN05216319_4621 [Duganella sp. CF402]|uniref:PhaM family polyhydroxyalkanoate granule multifunctional regulatory protein n=1 Tax=unclassified Duganella TaxID=2636909 RepID=UPI0008D53FFF|nr:MULTISPECIES: PhaM family polyhydroxyalkanoate granule multifunctional regulatory protein [unclassified Duganella]RZT06154.1 hypothetical protein EV582_4480 [Duganella sp. BK701]SEM74070.1 hypothetical protein SAMN05216319_4621 [Duganella sp. CF402]
MSNNPMNDTLDFVKSLWGSMSVPGLTAPTLSVEELDKKINDLKAVETWLNLNMSMLRGSIQALEVQRGTIATLKSVGASLASAVNTGVNDKSIFDSNPYASAFFHHAREADKTQAAPEAPAPAPEAKAAPEPEAPKPSASAAGGQPNAWWNLLQDQFKQAVSTAMASESMMTDAAVKFAAAAAGAGAPQANKPAASTPDAAKPAKAPAAARKPAAKKHPARKAAAKPAVKPAADKP